VITGPAFCSSFLQADCPAIATNAKKNNSKRLLVELENILSTGNIF
jgi:hypothetical protein